MERSEYSAWTKHDYKVALKRFYLWLRGGEDYPPQVKLIKTTFKEKDAILPDQLLTEEEVMKIVETSDSLRDKAFIMTLHESGARIGELGSLKISDVVFEEVSNAVPDKGVGHHVQLLEGERFSLLRL